MTYAIASILSAIIAYIVGYAMGYWDGKNEADGYGEGRRAR